MTHLLPANPLDHPAVNVWRRLSSEACKPAYVETLKLKKKSAVYRLTGAGPDGSSVIAKRCEAATARIEWLVYGEVLGRLPAPALRCLGFKAEPEGEFCWLFLEDAGELPYSPTCPDHRALAGRWLGMLHRAARAAEAQTWLPDHGPSHYRSLLNSSRTCLLERAREPALTTTEAALLRRLAAQYDLIERRWEELEDFCATQPRTLVHGDFVIKNLRIRNGAASPALLAFDWEMAGWGVPATDLTQFVGRCASPELDAYWEVVRQDWPQWGFREVQRLAVYGALLRLLDNVFWTTSWMAGGSRTYLIKPLAHLGRYHGQLRAGLRALAWKSDA